MYTGSECAQNLDGLTLPHHQYLSFLPSPNEQNTMPVAIQTAPNEETPLLKSRKISEPDSDVTLVEPLNQGSRTPSIKSKASVSLDSEAAKKISLPWAQFSIVLILQLAEPLTSQVIYPVSRYIRALFWHI